MTRRRWIADAWDAETAILRDAHASHLTRVLRAEPGQEFDIVAGATVRRGVIVKITETEVHFSLHESMDVEPPLPITVGLSIIRFERMEWALEKLTELGISEIVPLVAQRSEKHLIHASAKRVERWRKIARESAQQSRRSDVPSITEPSPLLPWLRTNPAGLRLLLSEQEQRQTLRNVLEAEAAPSAIFLCLGPEGGWTTAELTAFHQHAWQAITLGPRILRAETAAIAAASILSAWLK